MGRLPVLCARARNNENSYIETFNGRLRDECLNVNQFISMDDAREKIEAWRIDYNGHRPDSSLGNLTLSEFAAKRQEQRTSEVAIFWFTSVHQRGNSRD